MTTPVQQTDISDANGRRPDWEKIQQNMNGLLPVIVQHAETGRVLMHAYMNPEAWRETLSQGRVCFFSRSRKQLWTKGETSGHYLKLISWRLDCDGDCLLIQAVPHGPTCHLGAASCFDAPTAKPADTQQSHTSVSFLLHLEKIIADRAQKPQEESYTNALLNAGIGRIAQKVGEEGVEVALAAVGQDDQALLGELADLYYHSLVLLRARGLSLSHVINTLAARKRV